MVTLTIPILTECTEIDGHEKDHVHLRPADPGHGKLLLASCYKHELFKIAGGGKTYASFWALEGAREHETEGQEREMYAANVRVTSAFVFSIQISST
jgi:hypothetical protein